MRSEMTLLLLCGMTLLAGGCDRRSGENGQGGTNAATQTSGAATSGEVSPGEVPPGEAAPGGEHKGTFTATLDRSRAGTAAPDAIFIDPAGKDVTLRAFKGKPLLVNLWATWCGPCVAEMPMLDAVSAEHAAQGLTVLTVSQNTGEAAEVAAFFKKNRLPHLSAYRDPENRLGFHYATGVLPTTILYDRDGKEVVRVVGAKDWTDAEGRALIEGLLH